MVVTVASVAGLLRLAKERSATIAPRKIFLFLKKKIKEKKNILKKFQM
jgi:hypothetical protein